jgi:uncharacterized protein (DUF488 family)
MLFKKQEILLFVIDYLHELNITSKLYLEKVLFLLKEEYNISKNIAYYNFYPYKYGPFSRLSYNDKCYLIKEELLNKNELELTDKGKKYLKEKNIDYNSQLIDITNRFKNKKEILDYVYRVYPQFSKKSELETHKTQFKDPKIFTIGYEKKDIDYFLNQLINEDIDIVIDVRKNPFSMNYTFIGKKLESALTSDNTGIKYMHLPELGIDSEDRKDLKDLNDYKKLFLEYEKTLIDKNKQEKLNEIINLGSKQRIALLCFEKDQKYCHRGVIANYLRKKGFEVKDL